MWSWLAYTRLFIDKVHNASACVDTRTADWLVMRGPMASIVRDYNINTMVDD